MPNLGKKCNINIYVTPEVFEAVEQARGLIPRSTFLEHFLKENLLDNIKK